MFKEFSNEPHRPRLQELYLRLALSTQRVRCFPTGRPQRPVFLFMILGRAYHRTMTFNKRLLDNNFA